MVRKTERHRVRNVTVLQGEACMQQHKLLVCMLQNDNCMKVKRQPTTFVSRCKMWKLKEPDIRQAFEDGVMDGFDWRSVESNIDDVWGSLRDCLLGWLVKCAEKQRESGVTSKPGGGMMRLQRSLWKNSGCKRSTTNR